MTSTCGCASVTVRIRKICAFIYDCDCSLCRKAGAAWGYFTRQEVAVHGQTMAFTRKDKFIPKVAIHFCVVCSSTTHFTLTDAYQAINPDIDQVGVNMRLFEPEQLDGVEIQYPHGSTWSGEGPFGFRREKVRYSSQSPW